MKIDKYDLRQWVIILIAAILLAIVPVREWLSYWFYYKPFYLLFPKATYLPFYLYIGTWLLLFAVVALFVFNIGWLDGSGNKNRSVWKRTLVVALIVGLVSFFVAPDIYRDARIVAHRQCVAATCPLATLERSTRSNGRSISAFYKLQNTVNGRVIQLNYYQYKTLLQAKNEGCAQVNAYYLPNTGIVMMYKHAESMVK